MIQYYLGYSMLLIYFHISFLYHLNKIQILKIEILCIDVICYKELEALYILSTIFVDNRKTIFLIINV
jgi:hypothetical protein